LWFSNHYGPPFTFAATEPHEDTGKATGNRDLEDRGAAEKTGGKVKKKVGDVKKVFGK